MNLIQVKEYEMSQYGDLGIDITDKQAKGLLILSLISKFANAYSELISKLFYECLVTVLQRVNMSGRPL